MIIALCLVWAVLSVLSLTDNANKRYVHLFWLFCFILIVVAALRPVGSTPDSQNYEILFRDFDNPSSMTLIEPSFLILAIIVHLFSDDVHWLFAVYALMGVTLKFVAIKKYCAYVFLPLLVYFSNYYLLHDLIQIRVSIASALLLLSIQPLCEGRKKNVAVLYLLASFFHFSALVLFFLLLFDNEELSRKWRIFLIISVPLGYFIYFLHIDIFSIPLPFFQSKMEEKIEARDMGIEDNINVFNYVFLVRIVLYYFLLLFYNTLKEHNKYITMELKIMSISLFCFPAFYSLPVFGFRLSELFGIVDILTISSLIYFIRPFNMSKMLVVMMSLILFLINVFYNGLIMDI